MRTNLLFLKNSGKILLFYRNTRQRKNKSTKKAAQHVIAKMIFFDAHVLLLQFSDPSFLINKKKYKKSLKLTIGSEKKYDKCIGMTRRKRVLGKICCHYCLHLLQKFPIFLYSVPFSFFENILARVLEI